MLKQVHQFTCRIRNCHCSQNPVLLLQGEGDSEVSYEDYFSQRTITLSVKRTTNAEYKKMA